jgi:hypothetical protein
MSIVKDHSIVLLGLVFLLISSHAQRNAQINGMVRDAQTGRPVALTNVYLSGTTLGSSTDNAGNFSIEKIPYGTYELVAMHVAYQLYVKRVDVKTGEKLYYEIPLQPKILEGNEWLASTVTGRGNPVTVGNNI